MRNIQKERLRKFFKERPDIWIPLPEILQLLIAQYNSRTHDLRNEGMSIENKLEMVDGVKHSFYRYNKPNVSPPYQMKIGAGF